MFDTEIEMWDKFKHSAYLKKKDFLVCKWFLEESTVDDSLIQMMICTFPGELR